MDAQPGDLVGADGILSGLRAADQRRRFLAGGQGPVDLHGFVELGHSRALAVALARLVAVVLPGPIRPVTVVASVVVAGGWPSFLALAAMAGPADPFRDSAGLLFCLATSVICVLMLASAWIAWCWVASLADALTDLLAVSPGRGAFVTWLTGRFSVPRQLAACAAGAGLSMGLAYAMSHQPADPVAVSAWTYLVMGWAGAVGGDVVYWLYTVAEIPLRLRRCDQLQMAWIDPAHTPAVVRLCRVFNRVAAVLGAGVILIEASALAVTGDRPGALMEAFVIGFPVFAVATALYVGVQPYVTLSYLVRDHIDHIVDPLMAQMAHPPDSLLLHDDLEGAFRSYGHFRTLRRLPVRMAAVLQYVTGILASLIVYVVQQWTTFGPKK